MGYREYRAFLNEYQNHKLSFLISKRAIPLSDGKF